MNAKTLIFAALLVGLAGCSDRTTTPAEPAQATQAGPSVEPAAQPEKPRYLVFENVEVCVGEGWPQAQCERAWGTAAAMATVDAPAYPAPAGCQAAWMRCGPVQSTERTGWAPQMAAFAIGGEEPGDGAPTRDKPSFYSPLYIARDGRWVILAGQPDNPTVSFVDPAIIVMAQRTQDQAAD